MLFLVCGDEGKEAPFIHGDGGAIGVVKMKDAARVVFQDVDQFLQITEAGFDVYDAEHTEEGPGG